MKKKIEKIGYKFAGLMDSATLVLTVVFAISSYTQGRIDTAILLMIFHGVWCISMSLQEIRKHLKCSGFTFIDEAKP